MRNRLLGGGMAVGVAAVVLAITAQAATAGGTGAAQTGAGTRVTVTAVKSDKPAQRVDPVLAAAAKRFGLSQQKLEDGLVAVKKYIGSLSGKPPAGLLDPRVVAVFAKSTGIPASRARAVLAFLDAGWKADPGGNRGKLDFMSKEAVAFFAKTLHVSQQRARVALGQLFKLASGPKGTIDSRSPEFARIARGLGVSPKQLDQALAALKKFVGSHLPKPAPGKPAKPGAPTSR